MPASRQQEASQLLAQALAEQRILHLPGVRARVRAHLERVVALTQGLDGPEAWRLRLRAQAARAEDARHGAGQLSRSAQRAPTAADCEDGWQTVEAIVRGAEAAAADAEHLAARLTDPDADRLAHAAGRSAALARAIVRGRNHAYTFHADPGFSFGEGWYVAAAGVLCGVAIQVEEAAPQSQSAKRFLADAGLRPLPYRSRARANKALPALIADAFAADAEVAQTTLRRAFLGDARALPSVAAWVDEAMRGVPHGMPKVLVWVRDVAHDAHRNSSARELFELCELAQEQGLHPVLFGDAPRDTPAYALDLTLCWKLPLFQGEQMRRAQLHLFEHLMRFHALAGQVGVTSAGMDGPALMGLATMYLTDAPNPRLGRWVGAVPGYEEVVRGEGHAASIRRRFAAWAGT
ncbi:MAG: hypothetical protein AAF938_18585 [Myxococcota bacterium]